MIRRGCHIETASNGLECLTKLRQARPDVLVLDLNLPWGGGDGVLGWIREEQAGNILPVTILTGTPSLEENNHWLLPPVVRYLQKPFSLRTLLRAIEAVQDTNGWQHQVSADLAAVVQPLLEHEQPARHANAAGLGETYSWGAAVSEIGNNSIGMTLCYPFRPGTCLAVELSSASDSPHKLVARVTHCEERSERTWHLHCELVKPPSGTGRLVSPVAQSA